MHPPHIQGPYTCRCVWKILNLQAHSYTCGPYRAPTSADVCEKYWIYKYTPTLWHIQGPHICRCASKILNLQVCPRPVAHTGLWLCVKKYWIYKYTPTPATHTGPQHLQMCMKNTESTSTLPHMQMCINNVESTSILPHLLMCMKNIKSLQVHSYTHHIYRAPPPADVHQKY